MCKTINLDEYYIYKNKKLGEGSLGTVYDIKKKNSSDCGSLVVKIIELSKIADKNHCNKLKNNILKKLESINNLKNENIIEYIDYGVSPLNDNNIYIIMKKYTPITSCMKKSNGFRNASVAKLGIDICKALEEYNNKIGIHGNIKPSNIFIDDDGDYKLGDFGIIIDTSKGKKILFESKDYRAPELYKNVSSDTYSLGMVMYQLLNKNRLPFMPPANKQLLEKNIKKANKTRISKKKLPSKPCDADKWLKKIIFRAISSDPSNRYNTAKDMKDMLKAKENEGFIEKYEETKTILSGAINFEPKTSTASLLAVIAISLICFLLAIFVIIAPQTIVNWYSIKNIIETDNIISNIISNIIMKPSEIVFTPNLSAEEVKDEDIETSINTIINRLNDIDIAADNVRTENKKIIMNIDEEKLGSSYEQKDKILEYAALSGRFNIMYDNETREIEGSDINNITIETLTRDDILELYNDQLDKNSIEQIKSLPENKNLSCIKLDLSTDARLAFEDMIDKRNANMQGDNNSGKNYEKEIKACFDAFDFNNYLNNTYLEMGVAVYNDSEYKEKMLIINVDNSIDNNLKILNLEKSVLENDALPRSFKYSLSRICWETNNNKSHRPDKTYREFYEGQTESNKITDESVVVEFELYDRCKDVVGDDEFNTLVKMVKERLASLKIPYAIGYTGFDNRKLAVKVPVKSIGQDYFRLIGGAAEISICNPHKKLISCPALSDEGKKIQYVDINNENDSYYLQIDIPEEDKKKLDGEKKLYLVVNGIAVASTEEIPEPGKPLEFHYFNIIEGNKEEENIRAFLELIRTIDINNEILSYYRQNKMDKILTYGFIPDNDVAYHYNSENELLDNNDNINWGINTSTEIDNKVREAVESVGGTFENAFNNRNRIVIKLDSPVIDNKEKFVNDFCSDVELIYEECALGSGAYQEIYFTIKDELKGNDNDRYRFIFRKNSKGTENMVFDYYVSGPNFNKEYAEITEKCVKSIDFFSSKMEPHNNDSEL